MLLTELRARRQFATADVFGEVVVRRPVGSVFDFFVDARNEPSYDPEVTAAEKATLGPVGVGTLWRSTITPARGHARWRSIEITGFDRPNRITQRTYLASMHLDGTVTFTTLPQGTLVCWSWNVHPHGWLRLARPLLVRLLQRNERLNWSTIKHLLEEHLDGVRRPGAPPPVRPIPRGLIPAIFGTRPGQP